jgi:hypothetical protein
MGPQEIKQIIREELPGIFRDDPEIREFVLRLSREHFADKAETESRFDRILDELRRNREEDSQRWEEQHQRWEEQHQQLEEQNRRWEEQHQRWEEQHQQWEEQNRRWEEQHQRWEEQNRRWEEQNRRWEVQEQKWTEVWDELRRIREDENRRWDEHRQQWRENQTAINQILQRIQKAETKYDSTIGALGARWGLHSEQSFRNALKGILEDSFKVEVLNVVEHDETGEVFGRPEQIELDVVIKDGMLILCEIKSSISKSEMHSFYSKAEFYQKRHERRASRLLVISPMVAPDAYPIAKKLGIEVYSYAEDVGPEIFSVPESET